MPYLGSYSYRVPELRVEPVKSGSRAHTCNHLSHIPYSQLLYPFRWLTLSRPCYVSEERTFLYHFPSTSFMPYQPGYGWGSGTFLVFKGFPSQYISVLWVFSILPRALVFFCFCFFWFFFVTSFRKKENQTKYFSVFTSIFSWNVDIF